MDTVEFATRLHQEIDRERRRAWGWTVLITASIIGSPFFLSGFELVLAIVICILSYLAAAEHYTPTAVYYRSYKRASRE